jgi:hypothetical protein
MNFHLAASASLDLDPRLQWLWYSSRTGSFVVGDAARSLSLPVSDPTHPVSLDGGPRVARPCNLPVPAVLYEEFAAQDWRGFRFLSAAAYERAATEPAIPPVGDLLRTIVFGPDYGTYVLHPASGAVFSLRAGSLQLLRHSSEGFTPVGQTRTRGKAALAFAAHPKEPLIVYGDNFGEFFAQQFSADGFGKTRKIDAQGRKASTLEFIDSGHALVIGGTGYLCVYAYAGGKFTKQHEMSSVAVRNFNWVPEKRVLVLNQGIHGVSLYQVDEPGFTPCGTVKYGWAVDTLAVSQDLRAIAMLEKPQQWPAPARIHVALGTD